MRISYDHDIDAFLAGSRGLLIERILGEERVGQDGGVFYLDAPTDRLSEALFRYGRALTGVERGSAAEDREARGAGGSVRRRRFRKPRHHDPGSRSEWRRAAGPRGFPADLTIADLLVDDRSPESIQLFRGRGDGTFSGATSIDVGADPYRGMTLADVTGDGLADLITPNPDTRSGRAY